MLIKAPKTCASRTNELPKMAPAMSAALPGPSDAIVSKANVKSEYSIRSKFCRLALNFVDNCVMLDDALSGASEELLCEEPVELELTT